MAFLSLMLAFAAVALCSDFVQGQQEERVSLPVNEGNVVLKCPIEGSGEPGWKVGDHLMIEEEYKHPNSSLFINSTGQSSWLWLSKPWMDEHFPVVDGFLEINVTVVMMNTLVIGTGDKAICSFLLVRYGVPGKPTNVGVVGENLVWGPPDNMPEPGLVPQSYRINTTDLRTNKSSHEFVGGNTLVIKVQGCSIGEIVTVNEAGESLPISFSTPCDLISAKAEYIPGSSFVYLTCIFHRNSSATSCVISYGSDSHTISEETGYCLEVTLIPPIDNSGGWKAYAVDAEEGDRVEVEFYKVEELPTDCSGNNAAVSNLFTAPLITLLLPFGCALLLAVT